MFKRVLVVSAMLVLGGPHNPAWGVNLTVGTETDWPQLATLSTFNIVPDGNIDGEWAITGTRELVQTFTVPVNPLGDENATSITLDKLYLGMDFSLASITINLTIFSVTDPNPGDGGGDFPDVNNTLLSLTGLSVSGIDGLGLPFNGTQYSDRAEPLVLTFDFNSTEEAFLSLDTNSTYGVMVESADTTFQLAWGMDRLAPNNPYPGGQFYATGITENEGFSNVDAAVAITTGNEPAFILGDFNGDFNVTTADFDIMTSFWFTVGNVLNENGEVTGDGLVDLRDFKKFKADLFPGGAAAFAAAMAVPEPGTLVLLLAATPAWLCRRRNRGERRTSVRLTR